MSDLVKNNEFPSIFGKVKRVCKKYTYALLSNGGYLHLVRKVLNTEEAA